MRCRRSSPSSVCALCRPRGAHHRRRCSQWSWYHWRTSQACLPSGQLLHQNPSRPHLPPPRSQPTHPQLPSQWVPNLLHLPLSGQSPSKACLLQRPSSSSSSKIVCCHHDTQTCTALRPPDHQLSPRLHIRALFKHLSRGSVVTPGRVWRLCLPVSSSCQRCLTLPGAQAYGALLSRPQRSC